MRARRASTLFVLLVFFVLLAAPHPVSAQSSTTSSQLSPGTPQKQLSSGRLLNLPKGAQGKLLFRQADPATDSADSVEALRSWIDMRQERKLGPGLNRFDGAFDAAKCAHIRIFQAPDMDSEMIIEAPPGAGGNIKTFEGLPPCSGDLPAHIAAQRFSGPPILQVPPHTPFILPSASPLTPERPLPPERKRDVSGTKP